VSNLWIWNGPRNGYWRRNAETGLIEKPIVREVSASFESLDVYDAQLFWEDQVGVGVGVGGIKLMLTSSIASVFCFLNILPLCCCHYAFVFTVVLGHFGARWGGEGQYLPRPPLVREAERGGSARLGGGCKQGQSQICHFARCH
jgi:hypothetical protein